MLAAEPMHRLVELQPIMARRTPPRLEYVQLLGMWPGSAEGPDSGLMVRICLCPLHSILKPSAVEVKFVPFPAHSSLAVTDRERGRTS